VKTYLFEFHACESEDKAEMLEFVRELIKEPYIYLNKKLRTEWDAFHDINIFVFRTDAPIEELAEKLDSGEKVEIFHILTEINRETFLISHPNKSGIKYSVRKIMEGNPYFSGVVFSPEQLDDEIKRVKGEEDDW